MSQTNTGRIHWLGAGLSSKPGIRRLASANRPMTLWNRTLERAQEAVKGVKSPNLDIRAYEPSALAKALNAGDVVVSMLPATMHPEIARLCLEMGAHLVTTSYVSPAMRELDGAARAKGLCFVNEAGLDPGLDHMLAHRLVEEYRVSPAHDSGNTLSFLSYCGGFPKVPNEFKYKFSWSPIAVFRALKSPAKYIRGGAERTVAHPWKDLTAFRCLGEEFQVYPNRDSVPYVEEYGFDKAWKIDQFVRGTIRLKGWAERWKDLFTVVETADEAKLKEISDELWTKYAYQDGEYDRVVLYVGLHAQSPDGGTVWKKAYVLDEAGTGDRTAMAYLVSIPASLAVESVLEGRSPKGVSGPPRDLPTIEDWFRRLEADGVEVHVETD